MPAGQHRVKHGLAVTGTLAAVVRPFPETPTSLFRGGKIWFVSTKNGATWVTSADPTKDQSGLTFPLNDKARAASQTGVDAPRDILTKAGITDDLPEAAQSRECAATR
jgi:hypothetical protein